MLGLGYYLNKERRVSAQKFSLITFAQLQEPFVLNGKMTKLVSQGHDVVLQQTPKSWNVRVLETKCSIIRNGSYFKEAEGYFLGAYKD